MEAWYALVLQDAIYVFVGAVVLWQGALAWLDHDQRQQGMEVSSLRLPIFLFFVATEFTRPFFPIYVTTLAGDAPYLSEQTLTALPQMVWGAMALVGTPLGFVLLKRWGEKTTLALCALMATGALALLALWPHYYAMLVSRGVHAVAVGILSYVALVSLARKGSVSELGIFLGGVAAGAICAMVLGGAVAHAVGFSWAIGVSACVAFVCFLLLQTTFRSTLNKESIAPATRIRYSQLLRSVSIHLFALLVSTPSRLLLTGFVLYVLPIQLHGMGYSSAVTGQIMMVYFAMNYLLVPWVASFLDQYRWFKSTAVIGVLALTLGLFIFHWAEGQALPIVVAMAVLSLGMTISNAIQVPLISVLLPAQARMIGTPVLIAFFRTVERVGAIIGPAIAALVLRWYPNQAVLIFSGLMLGATLATVAWFTISAVYSETP